MKVLFVEPPKDVWFVMGEYLPPPYGIIQLAAYLEREIPGLEIEVLDCNAEQIFWDGMGKRIADSKPDVVASSSLATCNTYAVARTLETAKEVDPGILTVTGGQHFTATAQRSLEAFPVIDVIVRGEGELSLAELVERARDNASFRREGDLLQRGRGDSAQSLSAADRGSGRPALSGVSLRGASGPQVSLRRDDGAERAIRSDRGLQGMFSPVHFLHAVEPLGREMEGEVPL